MESLTIVDSVHMWSEIKESGWAKDKVGFGLCLNLGVSCFFQGSRGQVLSLTAHCYNEKV